MAIAGSRSSSRFATTSAAALEGAHTRTRGSSCVSKICAIASMTTIVLPVPGGPKTMYGTSPWRPLSTLDTASHCSSLSCGCTFSIGVMAPRASRRSDSVGSSSRRCFALAGGGSPGVSCRISLAPLWRAAARSMRALPAPMWRVTRMWRMKRSGSRLSRKRRWHEQRSLPWTSASKSFGLPVCASQLSILCIWWKLAVIRSRVRLTTLMTRIAR